MLSLQRRYAGSCRKRQREDEPNVADKRRRALSLVVCHARQAVGLVAHTKALERSSKDLAEVLASLDQHVLERALTHFFNHGPSAVIAAILQSVVAKQQVATAAIAAVEQQLQDARLAITSYLGLSDNQWCRLRNLLACGYDHNCGK